VTRALAVVLSLWAAGAFAAPPPNTPARLAKCQRDAAGFVKFCEELCAQQRKNKAHPNAAECRATCREQTAKFQKRCEK
jgi:hypothetical protein